MVFSCNILMSHYILYAICFGQRWDRLGLVGCVEEL